MDPLNHDLPAVGRARPGSGSSSLPGEGEFLCRSETPVPGAIFQPPKAGGEASRAPDASSFTPPKASRGSGAQREPVSWGQEKKKKRKKKRI